jgi:hypothetical protein
MVGRSDSLVVRFKYGWKDLSMVGWFGWWLVGLRHRIE